MRTRAFLVTVVLAMLVLILAAGCGGATATTVASTTTSSGGVTTATPTTAGAQTTITAGPRRLTYALAEPEGSFSGAQAKEWAKQLEAATKGAVVVEIRGGGSLLTADTMYDGLLQGIAAVGVLNPGLLPDTFPICSIADLPGLFNRAKNSSYSLHQVIGAEPLKELEAFQVIAAFASAPAYIVSIEQIDSLETLKGKKIATAEDVKTLEALGAVSVKMPQSELAQALASGAVDGVLSARQILGDPIIAGKAKFSLEYPLACRSYLALMKKDVFDSLPEDVRSAIKGLAATMSIFVGDYQDDPIKEAVLNARDNLGIQFVDPTPEARAALDKALAAVSGPYLAGLEGRGLPAPAYYKQFQEASTRNGSQH